MSTTTADTRTEFENVSSGVIGVVVIEDHKRKGVPLKPGETVWLTQEEEIATANAPRRDEDNPFAKGWLAVKTLPSQVLNRRPIGSHATMPEAETPVEPSPEALDQGNDPVAQPKEEKPADPEAVGAPPLPEGDPALGVRPPGEEVGTPQVVASGKRPDATRGQTVKTAPPIDKPVAQEGKPQAVVVGQGGARYVQEPGA